MKNKFITVVLVILMLIPTVVAIVNYTLMQGGQADSHNTVAVKLRDFYDNEYYFDRESGNDEMMNYFIKAISNAESVSALPTSIETGNYYTVTMVTTVDEFGYKFYYTTNASDCYCLSGSDAKAYKLKEADAKEFLSGAYAACLYENGVAPSLTLSGKSANPDSVRWKFKNSDGEYVEYDAAAIVKDELESITLEGGIAMNFSLEPDSLTVKIIDKATSDVIFNDDYAEISSLSVDDNMNVSVEACAKWYEDTQRTYYGEQIYKFDASFGAPAQFFAGVTEIQVGEFICVTGINVNDPDDISFQSEPDINYTPVFFDDGDNVLALIPFNWNLKAGTYDLTFSYGGSTQQINVEVKARGAYNRYHAFEDKTITIADAVVESYGSDEKRTVAETTLREIAKLAGEKRYFENGETLYYDDNDLTFAMGYGHTYNVKGTDVSFRNTGVDFRVEAGTELAANLGGEIVYAGILDYSGFTVVIDHGYGLKSWYAHLGSTSVKVGDIVKKGDIIGEAGESGFTATEGVHIGMTIFDTPICTYAIWKNSYRDEAHKGIVMYKAD